MKYWSVCCLVVTLTACSSRESPAPVTTLNDIKNYYKKYPQGEASSGYVVQTGDTLYSLAFRAGMDYRELAQLNNISPPYRIFVGQTLRFGNKKYTSIRGERSDSSVKAPKTASVAVNKVN